MGGLEVALGDWSQHPALLCAWPIDRPHNGGSRTSSDLKSPGVPSNHFHGIWHGSASRKSQVGLGISFTSLKGAGWHSGKAWKVKGHFSLSFHLLSFQVTIGPGGTVRSWNPTSGSASLPYWLWGGCARKDITWGSGMVRGGSESLI